MRRSILLLTMVGAMLLAFAGVVPAQQQGALKTAAQSTGTTSKDGRAITREYVGGF